MTWLPDMDTMTWLAIGLLALWGALSALNTWMGRK